ncbi:MAG: hypothetical protein AVDCRST_MAG50-1155, partial [uncultured Acidimicrobiales bacterium]
DVRGRPPLRGGRVRRLSLPLAPRRHPRHGAPAAAALRRRDSQDQRAAERHGQGDRL